MGIYTEYGEYNGKHLKFFLFKNILKDIVRPLTNKIVVFKYKDIWNVKKTINEKNLKGGMVTSYYNDYFNKRCSYVGLNTKFENIPCFPHGVFGVFISDDAKIGKNCVIFQDVTIGSNTLADSKKQGSPTIGDNVFIGAGAKIVGNIKIGNNVRIGAGAIVSEDIPDDTLVVLEHPRKIHKKGMDNRFIKKIGNNKYYYENEKFIKIDK